MKNIKFKLNRSQFETLVRVIITIDKEAKKRSGMFDLEKINISNLKYKMLSEIPKWNSRNSTKLYFLTIDINMYYFFQISFERFQFDFGEYDRNVINTFTRKFQSDIANCLPQILLN